MERRARRSGNDGLQRFKVRDVLVDDRLVHDPPEALRALEASPGADPLALAARERSAEAHTNRQRYKRQMSC